MGEMTQLRTFLARLLLLWSITLLLLMALIIPLLPMLKYLSKRDISYYYAIVSIVVIGLAAIMSLLDKE